MNKHPIEMPKRGCGEVVYQGSVGGAKDGGGLVCRLVLVSVPDDVRTLALEEASWPRCNGYEWLVEAQVKDAMGEPVWVDVCDSDSLSNRVHVADLLGEVVYQFVQAERRRGLSVVRKGAGT
jgi:hypothetical protein